MRASGPLEVHPPCPVETPVSRFPPRWDFVHLICGDVSFFPTVRLPASDGYHPEQTPDHSIPIRKRPLIILLCARKGPMIIPFPSGSDLWSYHSHPQVTPDHTIPIRKRPLIILLCARKGPMIIPFPSGSDPWSYYSHPQATSDHTIPIRKWPLIIPSPSGSDLWSYHPHPEATSDHTIPIRKWPLIIPFPSGSDLWSYHPHPEVTSDHTIPIRKWPLIILFPSASDLWSYHSHPEVTSDHTIPIRKWPLIIPFPSAIDPWSDYSHPEPKPRPCNYGLGTHRVRWTSDDQRSLPDGTSTWVAPPFAKGGQLLKRSRCSFRISWKQQATNYKLKSCFLVLRRFEMNSKFFFHKMFPIFKTIDAVSSMRLDKFYLFILYANSVCAAVWTDLKFSADVDHSIQ